MKLEFYRQIFEKDSNINFTIIRSVGAEVFHAEGRTDIRTGITMLTVALRNFANAPKTVSTCTGIWVTIVSA